MIHHLAIATKDIAKAHHFYTEVMEFRLVAAVKKLAPGGGWTKHVFYDMGDGCLFALWDLKGLEDGQLDPTAWKAGLSTGMGLPSWINHIAFEVKDEAELMRRRQRWLDHGYHVSVVDHEFIRSCYTIDPDGTMVEWTYRTRPLNEDDTAQAEAILADDTPAVEADYEVAFTKSPVQKSFAAAI